MKLPAHFCIRKRVIFTFLRSGFTRKEIAWILVCGKDNIDDHVERLMKVEKTDNYAVQLCDCVERGWVRKLNDNEKKYYKQLADTNEKKYTMRLRDDQIEWQKMHDELYPS